MTGIQAFATLAVVAAVTLTLRAWPFLLFPGNRETPEFLKYLGRALPYAIMGMLVVYCLRGIKFSSLDGWAPGLIAAAFVAAVHKLRHSLILSVVGGTAVYMVLIRVM